MPDIAHVEAFADGEEVLSATPVAVGTASASLTQSHPTLVLAIGNARNASSGSASLLELRIGGSAYARMDSAAPFGSPAYGALGSPQLASFVLVTPGASDEIEFFASDISSDTLVDSCRGIGLDLSDFEDENGRWHVQTANTNTIVTTPTSGWTQVGTELVVEAPRDGVLLVFVSAQYVGDGTEADTDREHARVEVDVDAGGFNVVSGSIENNGLGASGTVYQTVGSYAYVFTLPVDEGSTYTIRLAANGTDANGNIGWRRIRLHALEVARFEDSDVQEDIDTAGLTVVAGSGPQTVSGLSVTMNPPAARDYLVIGVAQGQFAAWPRLDLRAGGASYPANGVADAAVDTGVTAADDMTITLALDVVEAVSSSTALTMRMEAAAGGATNLWGTDCARTNDGTGGGTPEGGSIRLIAIRLATAPALAAGSFESDSSEATEIGPAVVRYTGAFESESSEATEMGPPTIHVRAWMDSTATADLAFAFPGGSLVLFEASAGIEAAAMMDLFRSAGAAPGAPVPTTVAINNSAVQIGSTPSTGHGTMIVLGGLRADEAADVEVWDGEPDEDGSTQIDTLPITAGEPMPLALWGYFSAEGRGLWLREADGVAVAGRVLSIEI